MISERVEHKQQVQGATCNTNKPLRQFKIGETVFAEYFKSSKQKWIEGTITDIKGLLSYKIKLTDETKVCRHVDSIKQRCITTTTAVSEVAQDFEGPTIESETQEIRQSQLVLPTPRLSQPPEQSESLTGV